MALGIVLALAYVFFLRTPPPAPAPTVTRVQGTYVFEGQTELRSWKENGAFGAVAGGNAAGRKESTVTRAGSSAHLGATLSSGYDARLRSELTASMRPGGPSSYSRVVGAWPPVWQVATRSPLDYQGLAAIVRSAVEDGDRTIGIKPLKDGDRKVWRADITFGDSNVELVVDQLTGIVVWCSRSNSLGRETFTATVDWTAAAPSSAAFVIHLPPDAKVETSRDGAYHYRPTLAATGVTVGSTPLESTLEPDGYTLRAVAVAWLDQAPLALLSGSAPLPPGIPHPTPDNEVAQLYTRGLTWFSIQQVAARGTPRFAALSRRAVDLYASRGLSARTEVLQYGALAGAVAHTWYAEDGPALYVADDKYAVTVRGGLTRQELISLAQGLQPLGSGGSASPSPSP